jgi:hypothetical protein
MKLHTIVADNPAHQTLRLMPVLEPIPIGKIVPLRKESVIPSVAFDAFLTGTQRCARNDSACSDNLSGAFEILCRNFI